MGAAPGDDAGGDDATIATLDSAAPADRAAHGPTLPAEGGRSATAGLASVSRDRYERGPELARGGMGRIIAARDVRHGRPVAIKELLDPHPAARARFEREALIAARLQHPAIVPIYEAGTWEDGEPFFAMKLVEGRSLGAVIADRRSLRDRLALLPNLIAVTDAMTYAHARGVIHRDLKPHNVLVGDYGETVVIDWGLARVLGDPDPDADDAATDRMPSRLAGDRLTVTGVAMGTPAYMAPEQARGEEVDARADVFALGGILYHLLAGRRPEPGARVPLDQLDLDVSPELLTIVTRAMAADLSVRYRDAGELGAELRRFHTGQLVRSHHYSALSLAARWLRRHRLAVGVTALVAAGAAVGWTMYRRATAAERLADANARTARVYKERSELSDRMRDAPRLRQMPDLVDELTRAEAAVAERPTDAAVWTKLAVVQNELSYNDEAETSAQLATYLAPADGRGWYVYGEILRINTHYAGSIEAYQRALAAEPPFEKARVKLMFALDALGRSREAEAIGIAIVARGRADATVYAQIGESAASGADCALAIEALERYRDAMGKDLIDPELTALKIRLLESLRPSC